MPSKIIVKKLEEGLGSVYTVDGIYRGPISSDQHEPMTRNVGGIECFEVGPGTYIPVKKRY